MALVLETDPDTGAEYVQLAKGRVARTVSTSDLVMVDLDRDGTVRGVEFAAGRASLLHDDWVALYSLAPELTDVLGEHR